jgi:hypothetical protein
MNELTTIILNTLIFSVFQVNTDVNTLTVLSLEPIESEKTVI